MSKPYQLDKEIVQLAPNSNLLAYKRQGLILNNAPIQKYVRLTASGLAANQTAVFDIDKYGLDLMPEYLLADFVGNAGNITFTITYYNNPILSFVVNGNSAEAGFQLPKIPTSSNNATIRVQSAQACNFIWVSCKQALILVINLIIRCSYP